MLLWRISKNRTLTAASLLALLGGHGEAPCLLPTDKSRVAVGSGCVALFPCRILSNESIKVELTLEGLVLGLLKVSWYNFVHESFQIVDLEGLAVVDPRNDFGIGFTLVDSLKHLVEFPCKGKLGRGKVWVLSEAGQGECANVHF